MSSDILSRDEHLAYYALSLCKLNRDILSVYRKELLLQARSGWDEGSFVPHFLFSNNIELWDTFEVSFRLDYFGRNGLSRQFYPIVDDVNRVFRAIVYAVNFCKMMEQRSKREGQEYV